MRGLCYTLRQKIAFECLSVRPSVRPSVRLRLVFTLYRMHFLTNFLQTWYKSWFWGGVSWDCRWVNFDNMYRVMALDLRYKFVFTLYLWHFFTDFLQTLQESWYWKGVSCDCRWVNFDKYVQSYCPWFTLQIGFCSLSLAFLYWFFSNFVWEFILGRSVLGSQMCKFRQMCTELWSLIYVRNWFSLSIFNISLTIFFKLGMRVDIGKECLGIADG